LHVLHAVFSACPYPCPGTAPGRRRGLKITESTGVRYYDLREREREGEREREIEREIENREK
jgi:hypothetical protein